MLITGLGPAHERDIWDARLALMRKYNKNVCLLFTTRNTLKTLVRRACGDHTFRLTISQLDKPGGALIGASFRRSKGACWHVHRDYLDELFQLAEGVEGVKVRVYGRIYRGAKDFKERFEVSGERIVPSTGIRVRDMCRCGEPPHIVSTREISRCLNHLR